MFHKKIKGMATFKAEVYGHQKKADGTYNIKIRVTHKRRKRYIATPFYASKDDLTRSLRIKNKRYIDLTDAIIRKYRELCDRLGFRADAMDVDEIVRYITDDSNMQGNFNLDFIGYCRGQIAKLMKEGREGTARFYGNAANSIVRFAGRESVSISEITHGFIEDWMGWMKGNSLSDKTVTAYVTIANTMHRRAKEEYNDEDLGIVRIPSSPFRKIRLPRASATRKRAITLPQMQGLINLPAPGTGKHGGEAFAKDFFILSFGLLGMNTKDIFTCTDYRGGRITYQRAKTRDRRADNAEMSVLVQPEIRKVAEKYLDPSGERVFIFHKLFKSCYSLSKYINRWLKPLGRKIGVEDLEQYAARHTWATLAANEAGVDKYTVHEALDHADSSMRITDVYIRKDWGRIDAANRKVLDLIDFSELV